jgi:hypothetical protein
MLNRLSNLITRVRAAVLSPPKFITRGWTQTPYLTRWRVLQPLIDRLAGEGKAIFLHHFQRSDADEPHNHPWPFVSIILRGGYYERTPGPGWNNGDGPLVERWYGPGRILVRPAKWIHSIRIPEGADAWTLIIKGVECQKWGFFCPVVGFRLFAEHEQAYRATGSGCG